MSIIERNIKSLGDKFLENIEYVDLAYRGPSESGEIKITGAYVMLNNLKLWLQSNKGDYYRRWNMGGILEGNLQQYPLTDDGASALQIMLRDKINTQFPTIEIVSLKTTPDTRLRGWRIQLIAKDTLTGAIAPLDTVVA